MASDLDNSYVRRWRERAEEMRTVAEGMKSDAKQQVLTLAQEWDRMADKLEERLKDGHDR